MTTWKCIRMRSAVDARGGAASQSGQLARSLMFVPGHREKMVDKAGGLRTLDLAMFDIEDGVPPARKAEARAVIAEALRTLDFGRRERVVRVNAIGSPDFEADLASLPLSLPSRGFWLYL